MKKILVTERQLKMLQEDGWQYSPEKIDEFVQTAKKDLENATKTFRAAFNAIITVSIGDIMDEPERFEKFHQEVEAQQKYYEKLYNKYYDIVEMYDWMERPDNVTELDRVNEKIDAVQNDLYRLSDSIEEIVDYTKKIKSVSPYNETSRDDQ
jgi:DNA repair ATPase RecN